MSGDGHGHGMGQDIVKYLEGMEARIMERVDKKLRGPVLGQGAQGPAQMSSSKQTMCTLYKHQLSNGCTQ